MRIGISGKAKAGKDTLASMLVEAHPGFNIHGFADRVKQVAMSMFPQMNPENLFGDSHLREELIPGTQITYRQVLLDVGKLGRSYSKDFWVESTLPYMENNQDIIIKDLRFENEYNFLKSHDFFLVRIKRKSHTKIHDISETEQDGLTDDMFDLVIENDKDLAYLCDQSQLILRNYETRQKLLFSSF